MQKDLEPKKSIISNNANEMAKHALSFDFILDTVAASHDIDQYLNLLKRDGYYVFSWSAKCTASSS